MEKHPPQPRYSNEEPKSVLALRALAATVEGLTGATTGAVVAIDMAYADQDGAMRVFAPSLERHAGGGRVYGPAEHPVTNLIRSVLESGPQHIEDIALTAGYIPLWSADSGKGAALLQPVFDDDERTTPLGLLIARRSWGPTATGQFSADDADRLAALLPIAKHLLQTTHPVIVCRKCGLLAQPGWSLVTFVDGEFTYGHKDCFARSETPSWWPMEAVRQDPLNFTRHVTTDEAETCWLTDRAITSWYRVLEELLGEPILRWEDYGFQPIGPFAVRKDPRSDW